MTDFETFFELLVLAYAVLVAWALKNFWSYDKMVLRPKV